MVEINKQMLLDRKTRIDELDEILDSVSGGASAGKRAVTNALVKEQEARWTQIVQQVKDYFSTFENDPDVYVGVVAGVRTNLFDKEITERVDGVLDSKTEEIKAATPNYTEEQLKAYDEERRDEVKKFKQIKELLGLFGQPADDVEDPKRRTGARGKRGPRAISLFTWDVGGVRMGAKEDSLTGVAAANDYNSVKELKDAMKAAGINLKEPGDEITFTMENGKVLHGVLPSSPEEKEDEDDDDEDDETPEATPED